MILAGHVSLVLPWYDRISWALLGMRVVIGLTMAAHGYYHFFGGGRIPGTARWFESMGMRPNGTIHAVLSATTELVGGLMMAAGALTPLAAASFVGILIVAAWIVHRPNGFFSAKNGWEYTFVLAVTAVGIATVGPGRYSVDWQINLETAFIPKYAFAIAAGVGVLSGVGLLVLCYRPPAKAAPDPAPNPGSGSDDERALT